MVPSLGASLVMMYFQLVRVTGQSKVQQSPQFLRVQMGGTAIINCSYTDSSFDYFLWYRQDPGKGPTLLIAIRLNKDLVGEGRFTVHLNKDAKYFFLNFKVLQPEDAGTYLCAASGAGSNVKLTWGLGSNLIVNPNIQNPQPALYQLRSPKSSNTSVCLLTDFGFYNGSIKNETVTGSEATVLEMMTMESKSYGAVTWGSKSNFTCTDAFRKDMFDFNQFSGSKCNSSHAEQGFETDRDLNLMNLSLIVLRIIFLKTVGFNLLMTLRLWSN